MSARYFSRLYNRKSCTSLIPISMTSTGYILFMVSFRRSNTASSSWYLDSTYRRCRLSRKSTGGVMPNTLVERPLMPEWKAGLTTSLKHFVRTTFRLSKVSCFYPLTFHLISFVLCYVSVIAVAGIL